MRREYPDTTPSRTRAYNGNRLVDYQTTHTGTILEGERLVVSFPADAGLTDVGTKLNEYASYYVTREPAASIAFIHNRMPVILPAAAAGDWLNVRYAAADVLKAAQTDMGYRLA